MKKHLNDSETILEFVNVNSLPLISRFTEDTASQIFRGYVSTQLMLFFNNETNNSQLFEDYKKHAIYNQEEGKF